MDKGVKKMSDEKKRKTGTREWAEHNRNIQAGCENDCRYCYARNMAERFKRCTRDTWKDPVLNQKNINEKPRLLSGRIMFPTTHDITNGNIAIVVKYLKGWLQAGNEILIVSKPDPDCIATLCQELAPWKDQITFRFTIGSRINEVLKFWEPNAPTYEQRVQALEIAFLRDYMTSVSAEPYLDGHVVDLFHDLEPLVQDVIWIGKMNRINQRVHPELFDEQGQRVMKIVHDAQTDEAVWKIYNSLKDNSKVRWKDSIKQVIGLPEESIG